MHAVGNPSVLLQYYKLPAAGPNGTVHCDLMTSENILHGSVDKQFFMLYDMF